MRFTKTHSLTSDQKKVLLKIWNSEYPQNLNYENLQALEEFLAKLEDQHHTLLLDDQNHIRGWYFDFIREGERWFIIILDAKAQGKKLGSQMIELAKQNRTELNGWAVSTDDYQKANGQPYKSPLDFYRNQGFEILHNTKLETDKIRVTKIYWSRATEMT